MRRSQRTPAHHGRRGEQFRQTVLSDEDLALETYREICARIRGFARGGEAHRPQVAYSLRDGGCIIRQHEENLRKCSGVSSWQTLLQVSVGHNSRRLGAVFSLFVLENVHLICQFLDG